MEGTAKLIPFSKIVIDTEVVENARENYTKDVKNLAKNILSNGLMNPLTVALVGKKYVLVAGFRRYSAIQSMSKLPEFEERFGNVACNVVEGEQKQLQQWNLIENLQRTDLTPAETASGMLRLKELGLTQKEIGDVVGKGQSYVSQLLKIVSNLIDPLWKTFAAGELSVIDALVIADMSEEEQNKSAGIYEEALAEEGEELSDGKAKKGKVSKAKKTAVKKAREAILPGSRVKFAITAKNATQMLKNIRESGINPNHNNDSYVDGVCDTLAGLLGEKELPFQTTEPAKPKKEKGKVGRPKRVTSDDDSLEIEEELDDVIEEEELDEEDDD